MKAVRGDDVLIRHPDVGSVGRVGRVTEREAIEKARERSQRPCVWTEGEVPHHVAEYLWDAVHDRNVLLTALVEAEQREQHALWSRDETLRLAAERDTFTRAERDAAEQREQALAEALTLLLGRTGHYEGDSGHCAIFRGIGRECDCGYGPAARTANDALRASREARERPEAGCGPGCARGYHVATHDEHIR